MSRDPEGELINVMGLMLTQLTQARSALRDIERSTANYGGYAFATAFSSGASFGAPPLLNGALMVHIVNIGDMTASSGFGGFLEGLLGGVGRFIGGLFGGFLGGTASAITLPWLMSSLRGIVSGVERILTRIEGFTRSATPGASGGASAGSGSLFLQIQTIANALTALFTAAGGAPDRAGQSSALPMTATGQRWLAMLEAATELARNLARVIDGLILLVPMLIGSLALLLSSLGDIKVALVELLQFVVRNVLLLRGVVLVTVFDIASVAARLAGDVLGILATAVERILRAIFSMITHILDGALAALDFVLTSLGNTVNALLPWLVSTLLRILTVIGDLRLFRVLVHVINIIPAVLPPLYELIRGSSPALTPAQRTALETAANSPIGPPTTRGVPSFRPDPFPNLSPTATQTTTFTTALSTALDRVAVDMGDIFRGAGGALTTLSARLDRAGAEEARLSTPALEDRYRALQQRSADFAGALAPALDAARRSPETGLERIANAYEGWLTGGGLDTILTRITAHFQATRTTDSGSIPGRVVGTMDLPRATVDIQDVTIEITKAPATEGQTNPLVGPEPLPEATIIRIVEAVQRYHRDHDDRGHVYDPGASRQPAGH